MTTPNSYVVGNWKMNLGPQAGSDLIKSLTPSSEGLKNTAVWVAPPAITIVASRNASENCAIEVGAQNVHWEENGAFTGELSGPMLEESGCSFAIIGHSERRHIFGESDELITRRALGALSSSSLNLIYCIGETLEQREAGDTASVLQTQLTQLFDKLLSEHHSRVIIAYEPVWAIGTGKVASLEEIAQAHADIIKFWSEKMGSAPCPPILYGGSVNPDNFSEIIAIPEVGGALVGGASLSADKFSTLIAIAEEAGA